MTNIVEPQEDAEAPSGIAAEPGASAPATGAGPGRTRRRRPILHAVTHGRGIVGLVLIGVIFLAGLLAPVIAPYSPLAQLPGASLLGPSAAHLFGTDEVNRDIFSRALYGIRVDVIVVFVAAPAGAVIGTALGVLASMVRPADVPMQRLFDLLLAFPPVILAIGITAVIGTGIVPVLVVVTFAEIPVFGRLIRTQIVKVRELPFVQSAEVIGSSRWEIMRRHILPNSAEPIVIQLALSMSLAIFLESAMSFIGIGIRPPAPSLGSIIAGSLNYLDVNPWYAVGPLLIVTMMVLSFQLIAQSIGAHRRR